MKQPKSKKTRKHGIIHLGKVNRPTMFFYLAVATSRGEGLVHQKLKYFHET